MNLIIDYSWWFLLLCVLLGIVYSGILYYRNKKTNQLSQGILWLLSISRFLVVFLLAFFLLSPLLKTALREVRKPIIVIAQDNSESLVIGKDSLYYQNVYKKSLSKLVDDLSDDYAVELFSFGDEVVPLKSFDSLWFAEKQTDISQLFENIETRYSNRNVGALILASDGLYNKGQNPLYASQKVKVPVYTVALGDTTIQKDLILAKALHNKLAYLGNEFPVEILVNSNELMGERTRLSIWNNKTKLYSKTIDITSDNFTITVPVLLKASSIGMQRYRVVLSSIEGEVTLANNYKNVYIDVLNSKQKIAIVSDGPHPDVAAIGGSLKKNQNYEVSTFTSNEFKQSVKQFNLVILHQLPNRRNKAAGLIKDLQTNKVPVWIISGANSIVNSNYELITTTSRTNECEAIYNESFPLFTLSNQLQNTLGQFPALHSPYGNISESANASTLFYQRIGNVETSTRLFSFETVNDSKMAILYGEGLWRWRLQDYLQHNNHELFDELISKTVQYLAVKDDKSLFKVNCPSSFLENEAINMRAEVYNESYELINSPEVTIKIVNSENEEYPFTFTKRGNAYQLDAGLFPEGQYSYRVTTKAGTNQYVKKGIFSVRAIQVEAVSTIADHQLLFSISEKKNGEMFYPDQLTELGNTIKQRDDIQTISFIQHKLSDLINQKWIFFLLLTLLTLEWVVRKRNGLY